MPIVSNADDIATTRRMILRSLDDESDFVVCDSEVTFLQTFETVEFAETFSRAPPEIIEAARMVLTSEKIDSLPKTVRETVHFSVGCNKIPLFVNVSGGRGRTLFEFRWVSKAARPSWTSGCFPELPRESGLWWAFLILICLMFVGSPSSVHSRHSRPSLGVSLRHEDKRKGIVQSIWFVPFHNLRH